LAAAVTMLRLADWTPPPHATEHAPKADHALTTQSTGHGCALHGCVFVKAGHAAPPFEAAFTIVAEAVCTPPPHVAEHEPNGLNSEMTQSTGQA